LTLGAEEGKLRTSCSALDRIFERGKEMSAPTCNWPGLSGTTYVYWMHPIGTSFQAVPGNYIFAKEIMPGKWKAVYVGQTNNLGGRLTDHEREAAAIRQGATRIHVHTNQGGEAARKSEEKDLILNLQPICNDQYVYSAAR
jgi:hypothetical protein